METVAHMIAVALKLGVTLCLLIAILVYGAYALESGCMNPTGCKAPKGAYDQGDEWNAAQKRMADMERRSWEIGHQAARRHP